MFFFFSLMKFYYSKFHLCDVNSDIIVQESAITFYFNVFKKKKKNLF